MKISTFSQKDIYRDKYILYQYTDDYSRIVKLHSCRCSRFRRSQTQ